MEPQAPDTHQDGEQAVRALYHRILASWNARDAGGYAACFAQDGTAIGFDGSQMRGRDEIARTLTFIFNDHMTGRYVGIVRGVRFLAPDVALLESLAGIVPAGQSDIAPHLNAVQTVVATRNGGSWHVALFQNTPAQLHGRPDLVDAMSTELRALL